MSEMQRATLLLHTMEHMVFLAAIFTREIKSTITFVRYSKIGVGTITSQNITVKEIGKKTLEQQWF